MASASNGGRPSTPGRTFCANAANRDQSIIRSISSSFLFDPSRGSAKALANPSCFIRRSSQRNDGITESLHIQGVSQRNPPAGTNGEDGARHHSYSIVKQPKYRGPCS